MLPPLASPGLIAGLNNQKLAIVGMALRARAEGRGMRLPDLVEFRYGTGDYPARAIGDLLDRPAIEAALARFGIDLAEADGAAEEFPGEQAFGDACETIARLGLAGDWDALREIGALIAAMRPTVRLEARCAEALAWLRGEGVMLACQLRIERDWLVYAERRIAQFGWREELYVSFERIFAKLERTLGAGPRAMFVTCDEGDLPVSIDAIRRHAHDAHGFRLLFKRDLPPACGLADGSLLEQAIADFRLAGGFATAVGHSRSTFFNMLALGGGPAECWLYNAIGDDLVRRTDHGAFVEPWRAAGILPPDKLAGK